VGIIQFDIRHPNGQREASVVEGERALIGSGSHCDVRLPMDQAAHEQVLIEALGGTLRAEAKADHPPVTLNHMPLGSGTLGADSVLGIGGVRLFVTFVPDLADGANLVAQKKESKPVLQLALIAGFTAAAFLLLEEDELEIAPPPRELPELFASTAVSCPRSDPVQALALAEERSDLAHGRRERMPFFVTDGVNAVNDYLTAAACFRAGGAAAAANEAEDAAKTLRHDLSDDFRARRIRLTHALALEDYDLARRDVAVLRAMTYGRKGAYVEWLASTEKQLPLSVAQ
jgi:hypothetical protein